MKKNNTILGIIGIVLFAGGIVSCIAAVCGHEPAYSAAACCFAASAGVSATNKDKK